ncbi:hypothetical protein [Burkholderia anthina]|uniref:Uncharacterized protein n=1 Tax=Burkholderia anthina TaxID=179879 RepID=A0A6P2G5X0_9BURK|nr:hypothetical protein [Burkholderia anthina]MBM2766679.1 hypothetical protein [Burkholderia anthina]VVU48511.1 hypothetical protein BAN20980_01208 [Burkholderia anthina]
MTGGQRARGGWQAAIVVAGPALAQLAVAAHAADAGWIALAAVATLAGWRFLAYVDAATSGAAASRALAAGTLGMLAGFAWDAHGMGLPLAVSLCGATRDVGAALWSHVNGLPAMHVGMLAGGIATMRLRRDDGVSGAARPAVAAWLRGTGCCVAMLTGMSAGALAAGHLASLLAVAAHAAAGSPVAMTGGMFAGMTWGMAGWACMRRGGRALRRSVAAVVSEYRDGQHRPVRP